MGGSKIKYDLYEYHWVTISYGITPTEFLRIIRSSDLGSLDSLSRCRHIVCNNMFNSIYKYMKIKECRTCDIYTCQNYLINNGYIPKIHNMSNHKFITYVNKNLIVLNIPNTTLLRMYWERVLCNVKYISVDSKIQPVLQEIVLLYPGPHHQCTSCGWLIPIVDMHTDIYCCYCHDIENKNIKLKIHKDNFYDICYSVRSN